MFPLLIVLTVLGSCALYLSIINSVINCESFQFITLEVTTHLRILQNPQINLSDNRIIAKSVEVALRATLYIYCRRNKLWNDP